MTVETQPTTTATTEGEDWNTYLDFTGNQGAFKTKTTALVVEETEPLVRIYAEGRLHLNGPALKMIGNPKTVVLSFNPKDSIITIRAAMETDIFAFPVVETKNVNLSYGKVGATRFLKAIQYPYEKETKSYGKVKASHKVFGVTFRSGRILFNVAEILKEAAQEAAAVEAKAAALLDEAKATNAQV
ncbi:MAG: hypothetical protein HXX20_09600 [Chloroflexi bacterium]|nr:hypothetical protein [Chloroflexota bacterium]